MPETNLPATTPQDWINHWGKQQFGTRGEPLPTVRGMDQFAKVFRTISRAPLPKPLEPASNFRATGAAGHYYDSYLVMDRSGPRVVVYMNIQFRFIDLDATPIRILRDTPLKWSPTEKQDFCDRWRQVVTAKWNTLGLTTAPTGQQVPLEFHFRLRQDGDCLQTDHWSIEVRKHQNIFPGGMVNPSTGFSKITRQGLDHSYFPGFIDQAAVNHEFAHMLGFGDEYEKTHRYYGDNDSIAHSGNLVRSRHYSFIKAWADSQMKKFYAGVT